MRPQSLFLAVALTVTAPVFADEVLQQANTLIGQQQAGKAVELLAPLEDERAGTPDYDYLLGLSLLESGDPSRAIFAFERCLAVAPDNGPCRVQMARTHLAIGETPNARAELKTINDYNPPPAVQALVAQYLGVINKVEQQQKRRVNVYAQVGAGYDSNINSAPADAAKAAAALPSFSGLQASISTSEEAAYASVAAGAGLQYKFTPSLVGLADLAVQNRSYIDHNDFNYQTVDLSAGTAFQRNRSQYLGKLMYQNMWLDSENYRDSLGVMGQYQYSITDLQQLSGFVQFNQLRYDGQSVRDADRLTLGLAYSQGFESALSPVFFASIYGGSEDADNAAFDYFSQDFTGLRLGGMLSLNDQVKLNASASVEQREFQANFPLFGKARDETQTDISLGLSWKLSPRLSLQPNYAYSRNNSNIALIDSTRHVAGIDVRLDW